jgi:chromosome segregation ATPase
MTEMTPETLGEWAVVVQNPDMPWLVIAEQIRRHASAWEADLAFANEDATSMNNQLIEANARIEALDQRHITDMAYMSAADETIAELRAHIEAVKREAAVQAENEALWFAARTAPEAYLQRALRRLHAIIEGDDLMAALAAKEGP